jgi:alcohol dehydrogenase (NADP+)
MPETAAYGTHAADQPLARLAIRRRTLGRGDVRIAIRYCGVCHSDLHFVRNEWRSTTYPAVPGHEIVGHVSEVGAEVRDLAAGDAVGVGCMVDSCRTCASCREGLEQYCEQGAVGTYGGTEPVIGGPTFGGYSRSIVVDRHFVLRIPQGMELSSAAPLLCAGITLYSPLRHWGAGPGKRVGIIGLGGLGHMGVKLSHALGAYTVLFTSSPGKAADARRLGADAVVISTDAKQMATQRNSFDLLIDTVSAPHDHGPYLDALKRDATLVQVGAPGEPLALGVFPLILKRRHFAGSAIGGIAETQEMLDFCAAKGFGADVEVIGIGQINEAYERMLKSDVKYRFSIDMSTL